MTLEALFLSLQNFQVVLLNCILLFKEGFGEHQDLQFMYKKGEKKSLAVTCVHFGTRQRPVKIENLKMSENIQHKN